MPKSLITTVAAWRFERPLAIALAVSAAFMVMAMPPGRFSSVPVAAGFQPALALVFGLVLGGFGYVAMIYPWPRGDAVTTDPSETEQPEHEQGQLAATEVSLRLRRADRHPDAPVREPIFASRELGSPFMEVGASPPPAATTILDADYAEIAPDADHRPEPVAMTEPEQQLEPEPEPMAVAPEPPAPEIPIAAFAPEDGPAPVPSRPSRESIGAMMERLSAGLERRAAHGGIDVPQARRPALREALDELNRLAARRG